MAQHATALDDPHRLNALRSYEILDTQPEPAFDRLATLAAHICGTPYAAIVFVDDTRQFVKARVGFTDDGIPGKPGFDPHAISQSELMVVPDACRDSRFATHPLVIGPPHVRFYAGAPLMTDDGHVLGTLCVLDRAVRQLSKEQADALLVLAPSFTAALLDGSFDHPENPWRSDTDKHHRLLVSHRHASCGHRV